MDFDTFFHSRPRHYHAYERLFNMWLCVAFIKLIIYINEYLRVAFPFNIKAFSSRPCVMESIATTINRTIGEYFHLSWYCLSWFWMERKKRRKLSSLDGILMDTRASSTTFASFFCLFLCLINLTASSKAIKGMIFSRHFYDIV